jgi:hypothetical protein
MKKTQGRKLQLNRETLRRLKSEDFAVIQGGGETNWQSVPSCIDGCPSAMCTSILPNNGG